MSTLIVLAVVFALAVLAMILFVAIVVGIHSDSRYREMTTRPQGPFGAMVRRLLGVYVRKPTDTDTEDDREECLTGQPTDWWHKGGGNR